MNTEPPPPTTTSAAAMNIRTEKDANPQVSPAGADKLTKSTGELLQDLASQITDLIHDEVELAKAEMSEKVKTLGVGAGMFGGSALMGIFAGAALIAAAIAALAGVLSIWAAALIVGGGLAAVAGILALWGKSEVERASPPVPQKAMNSTKEDVTWLKTQARSAKP
ncbi:MAG TPA: phage holin family protein [Acidimicrobiales bacterium]